MASNMLCMETESSAGAVQSMKLLQELLQMTENEDKNIFTGFLSICAASVYPDETNPSSVQSWLQSCWMQAPLWSAN